MTRFARAKGSKASNEKVREDSTPWHVMKYQLEEALNKEKSSNNNNNKTTKTARQLLAEKDSSLPVANDWAEFDNPKIKKAKSLDSRKIEKSTEKKIKKKKLKESLEKQTEENFDVVQDVSEKIKSKKPVTKKDKKVKKNKNEISGPESEPIPFVDISKESPKKKKQKIRVSEATEDKPPKKKKINESSEKSEENSTVVEESKAKSTEKLSKRQKRNLKKKNQTSETVNTEPKKSVFDTEENDWNSDVKFGNRNNPKIDSKKDFQSRNHNQQRFGRFERPHMKKHHLRKPKIRDDGEHKRRKPMQNEQKKFFLNGMEVEVTLYDGFPVQKEDAIRLKELKQQMVLKGIPKSEIDAAMKLERRKAEKALTRLRKQVCFHCRKSGHNLSECPEMGKEETVTGICFKCGSTEHTHFECKVTKSDDYRYAKCFICREQGHVAKQCPDNPRGLYPKGGACKICGDVTHLKKDCPDIAREKEETTITVKTISDSALESIEEGNKVEQKKEPKKKIVKF